MMDRDYEIKKIPGSSRYGLYMGPFLLARIERGMEREMQHLKGLAELMQRTAMNDAMSRPVQLVVKCGVADCEGNHLPQDHNTVTEAEIRADLDLRSL